MFTLALLAAAILLGATPPGDAPAEPPPAAAPDASAAATPPPTARRPLSLAEALQTARQHQPQLQQARAAVEAADARADEARASLLPQVNASAAYQRTTANPVLQPGSTQAAVAQRFKTYDDFAFGATASQLVWDFGQASGRWRAARATLEAERESEQAAWLQTALQVRAAYFAARAARELVDVAAETVANQEAHLRQIEGFVRAGTRPTIDLAQARTDRANAEVQRISAENGYQTALLQLDQAMGLEAPLDFDVGDDTMPPIRGEEEELGALLPEGLEHRPDVRAASQAIRAQGLALDAIGGAYLPTLGVSTSVSDVGPTLGSTVANWNATATLTWNLFQGGLTTAQQREARATADGLGAQLTTLRQQVRLELEQARLAVRAARSVQAAAVQALENARELQKLAEGRYRSGVGSVIELGDAQVALTAAAAQRVQARYNLATSRAQLLHALGRGEAGD
jgi:outer membrane protein